MEKHAPDIPVLPGTGGGSVISTLHDEVADESNRALSVSGATDDQLFEKIEAHLLEKIQSGDKAAEFLLGQFYYEEVLYNLVACSSSSHDKSDRSTIASSLRSLQPPVCHSKVGNPA